MTLGRYPIPKEMEDEDKYLKFFTKLELLILVVPIVISFFLVRWGIGTSNKLCLFISCILAFIVVGVFLVCVKLKVPERMYMFCCGEPAYIVILRVLVKKFSRQTIYVKNYEEREIS